MDQRDTLFSIIVNTLNNQENKENIQQAINNVNGNIETDLVKKVIDELKVSYEIVDGNIEYFQNINNTGLNISVKCTENENGGDENEPTFLLESYYPYEYPSDKVYYIIFDGNNIISTNGRKFIENSPWISEYLEDVRLLKERWQHRNIDNNNMLEVKIYDNITIDISFLLD